VTEGRGRPVPAGRGQAVTGQMAAFSPAGSYNIVAAPGRFVHCSRPGHNGCAGGRGAEGQSLSSMEYAERHTPDADFTTL
jgi:hypothetical protein